MGLAATLTPLCVEGLKQATRLPRPDGDPSGFPSGHTTFAFALVWLLARAFPRGTGLWFAAAIAVGWSRVEGHAHFPYQAALRAVVPAMPLTIASPFQSGLIIRRSPCIGCVQPPCP